MRLNLGLPLILTAITCNPCSRVMEGSKSTSETASTAASENNEHSVDTTVLQTGETYNESTVASEPISVGGAFLTCQLKNRQSQGSVTSMVDCDVSPLA